MLLLSTCGYMFPLACHTNFLPAVGGSCYEGRCGEALRTACLSIRIIGFHRHAHLGSLGVLCLLPFLTFVVLNGKYISVFPNGHFPNGFKYAAKVVSSLALSKVQQLPCPVHFRGVLSLAGIHFTC